MNTNITSATTDEEYNKLVDHWKAAGCTMLPDTPQEIGFRESRDERHEGNVLWLRKRVEESKLAACAAVLVACLWASWEAAGCASSIANAPKVRQAMGAAIHADDPGKVRRGLTAYQAGLEAERDLWLRPRGEIS